MKNLNNENFNCNNFNNFSKFIFSTINNLCMDNPKNKLEGHKGNIFFMVKQMRYYFENLKIGKQIGFDLQLGWISFCFIKCGKHFIIEFAISN